MILFSNFKPAEQGGRWMGWREGEGGVRGGSKIVN